MISYIGNAYSEEIDAFYSGGQTCISCIGCLNQIIPPGCIIV